MYTIAQAAARTGLRIPTIRAWERRYGIVRPTRTTGGYRLYDDEAIARLVAMRHLVDVEGWRPSQAAERVIEAGPDVAESLPPRAPAGETAVADADVGRRSTGTNGASDPTFVAAASRFDVPTMDRILDEGFAAQRFETAMEHRVFPALRAIGDGWRSGAIDVAVEHAASETVRRRLARFYDAAGSTGRTPTVVVGLPPGGLHEIGAFAFAVACRRAGIDVLYLGADVPLESWLQAVHETRARVAVLGVITASDVAAAESVIAAVGVRAPQVTCAVGGPSAGDLQDTIIARRLTEGFEAAVATVGALVAEDARDAR